MAVITIAAEVRSHSCRILRGPLILLLAEKLRIIYNNLLPWYLGLYQYMYGGQFLLHAGTSRLICLTFYR